MLSVAECRSYLQDSKYSDEEIENIRDFLYAFSTRIIKKTVEENDFKKTITSKSK
jgi:hypothetical protein